MPLFRRTDDEDRDPTFEEVVDRALRALGREHDRRETVELAELEALLGSKASPPSQRISSTMDTVRTRSRKPQA